MNISGLKKGIESFYPAYFALVMSTGIVSIASHLLQYFFISNLLFWINNVQYGILLLFFILRLSFFFTNLKNDLASHAEGAGFLTFVAASCLLGTQYVLLKQIFTPAILLWVFALAAWLLLMYSFFIVITIKKQKPSLEEGMSGSWLMIAVSIQSLSILGTLLAPHLTLSLPVTLFFTLSLYLLGGLFYIILITIIFYRITFFPMKAEEFKPSYWIDIGAAAISTLAGATLIKSSHGVNFYQDFIPTIKALSLLFWVASSWWIPIVFVLEIWRHKKIPLRYHPSYWSMVFPLGMYTVSTWQFAEAMQYPFLKVIPKGFIFIAWMAWLITFVAMCFKLIKSFASPNII